MKKLSRNYAFMCHINVDYLMRYRYMNEKKYMKDTKIVKCTLNVNHKLQLLEKSNFIKNCSLHSTFNQAYKMCFFQLNFYYLE